MKIGSKLIKNFIFTSAILFIASSSDPTGRDGSATTTVKIGNQEWMPENLNVTSFQNGDIIPEAKTNAEWEKARAGNQPVWCYYNSDPDNGKKYGKLYNWFAVVDARGLCPDGWHIPSDEEWNVLVEYLGSDDAGTDITGLTGWNYNGNGKNAGGFNALPGGYRYYGDGTFNNVGDYGYWWSSTENQANNAWYRVVTCFDGPIGRYAGNKRTGFSVRCIKNKDDQNK
jgi:uncharacterized protein (TIGR02145 family)